MFGPSQMGTVTATRKRAYPDSLMDASTNYLTGLLQGDYLHGGQGFNEAMDAAANNIQPRVQSAFNSAGRLNSGLAQEAMSSGLADAFASLYGNERQLQSLAALQTNPVTETSETPYFGNELASALGIGSSLIGLGQGLFGGGGGGGLFGSISDWFGGDSSGGGDFDFGGAGGGVGNASPGGVGGIPSPPGSSSVLQSVFGGGSTQAAPGSIPLASAANALGGLSPALVSSLTSLGGFSGGLSGGAGALASLANPATASGLSPGLVSSLTSLGTGGGASAAGGAAAFPGAFGSSGAGSLTGAGGALSGGLGAAMGAAAPLALAGFGWNSIRNKAAAQQDYLAPVLDQLYANNGQTATVNGVTGVPLQTPDGKTYLVAPGSATPDSKGNGRALYGVYDPSTGQYGAIHMNGFRSGGIASEMSESAFMTPAQRTAPTYLEGAAQREQERQRALLDSGAMSFGD